MDTLIQNDKAKVFYPWRAEFVSSLLVRQMVAKSAGCSTKKAGRLPLAEYYRHVVVQSARNAAEPGRMEHERTKAEAREDEARKRRDGMQRG